MQTAADFQRERAELDAILASGIFSRAPSLAQLLTYICAKYFDGVADQIKEYNIAVEALSRPENFDQKKDSIVRVEAHRLRKRLKEYYEAEGDKHPVHILIPPGQYAPRFVSQEGGELIPVTLPRGQEIVQPLEMVQNPPAEFTPLLAGSIWRFRVRRWRTVAALMLLAVLGFVIWRVRPLSRTAKASQPVSTAPTLQTPDDIRILAGTNESYIDHLGRVWEPDRYFNAGGTFAALDHPISGTRDPRLYQSRREGPFSYDIPVKPGVYELRLYFAETLYGESNLAGGGEASRVFNVRLNGSAILSSVDVIADAGPSSADVRVFKDVKPAPDGKVHLSFDPMTNLPFINAIEITPGTPGKLNPIRIIARDHSYTDKHGRVWEADRFFRGGQSVLRYDPVTGTDDPELYRGERFGNLTYAIPVAAGRYQVTLKFSETWFGPNKPSRGGVGNRVFDILCNGLALTRNFDIYGEAGGDHAVDKIYHGLQPSPQGKLVLSLVPVRNYACINAIEVVDEGK